MPKWYSPASLCIIFCNFAQEIMQWPSYDKKWRRKRIQGMNSNGVGMDLSLKVIKELVTLELLELTCMWKEEGKEQWSRGDNTHGAALEVCDLLEHEQRSPTRIGSFLSALQLLQVLVLHSFVLLRSSKSPDEL